AYDDVLLPFAQFFHAVKKFSIKIKLVLYTLRSSSAIRKIYIDKNEFFKFHFQHASFVVKCRVVKAGTDAQWFVLCPDSDSGVTFLLRRIEIALIATEVFYFIIELVGLGFCFLDA